jgi:outer membrane protein TolC
MRITLLRGLTNMKEEKLSLALLITLLMAVNSVGIPAAQELPEPISLERCIDLAQERYLGVMAKEMSVAAAGQKTLSARADLLPHLSFEGHYSRLNEAPSGEIMGNPVSFGKENIYSADLVLRQPLFTGWSLTNNVKQEELGLDIEETGLEILRQDLRLQTVRAYFEVLTREALLDVAQKSVEELEAHLQRTRDFFEAGMVPKNDLLRSEVEKAGSVLNLLQAESALEVARAKLNNLLYLPLEKDLVLENILDSRELDLSLDELTVMALANRPELEQMRQRISRADVGVDLARSDKYPQLFLVGDYTLDGDGGGFWYSESGDWSINALASWHIFDWGKVKHRVGEARSRKAQVEFLSRQLEEDIRLEVKETLSKIEVSRKNIDVADTAVVQAEENLRISSLRYQANVSTSTEVLDAETLLTMARVSYSGALHNYNVAIAELEKAVGVPLR